MEQILDLNDKVILFNGEAREVNKLKVGDLLLNENGLPEEVTGINVLEEKIYSINYKVCNKFDACFYVPGSQIMRLRKRIRRADIKKYSLGERNKYVYKIVEIKLEDLNLVFKSKSNCYYLTRSKGWNLYRTKLPLPPYELGSKIFSNPLKTLDFLSKYQRSYLNKFCCAGNLILPKDYIYGDLDSRKEFLAGMIDSYAGYDKKTKCFIIKMLDFSLVEKMQSLCSSVGCDTYYKTTGSLLIDVSSAGISLLKHNCHEKTKKHMIYTFEIKDLGVFKYRAIKLKKRSNYLLLNGMVMIDDQHC